ncbi:MAG: pyruvate dehydrogenase (acetyl-transferring) E1 component subunit alpha [Oxalobacter sp.]|nr:MAG: pyruvate dehydrogenase (acetyl-transferring) E1 component subunit alpha [Oxalobacter sp.]
MSLLGDMMRIRMMEEQSAHLYGEGKIRGFLHLYIGEEAVAVGALRALSSEDNVVGTYRDHGHALIRGIPMKEIMAEMFGKQEGCSRGRGGSMHLFSRSARFFGGNAIVAAGMPMAIGMALADKMNALPRVTASIFGDGAVSEGAFHETMNLAVLWQLPVLFLCENNFYAMGTALDRAQSQTDLCVKAASYRMPAMKVDGMDVVAVHEAAKLAAAHVRAGAGPYFLELQTYRFRPHSMYDPDLYRERSEIEEWKKRDPIQAFAARLKKEGKLTGTEYEALAAQAKLEVQKAVAFAEAGTLEPVEDLFKNVTTPEAP